MRLETERFYNLKLSEQEATDLLTALGDKNCKTYNIFKVLKKTLEDR